MEYLGLINDAPGIGDKLQFAAIPENYYRSTGNKVVDLSNCWVYEYNPYVVRNQQPTLGVINLWSLAMPTTALSKEDMFAEMFKIKTFVRHPRLYRFEEEEIQPQTMTVHTTARSRGGIMADQIIAQIQKNYPKYTIYQIGGIHDKPTPFVNKMGLDIWDTAKLIASSEIFIGVNSSMMNLARCYPRIRKKLVFNENLSPGWKGIEELKTFRPVTAPDQWIDYNWEYYNTSDIDIGISYSYLKI